MTRPPQDRGQCGFVQGGDGAGASFVGSRAAGAGGVREILEMFGQLVERVGR